MPKFVSATGWLGWNCLAIILLSSCVHQEKRITETLNGLSTELELSEQLVWVMPPREGILTQLKTFEKREGRWVLQPQIYPAVVGQRGLARVGAKVEGDLKTPQGLFSINRAFGKAKNVATRLHYEQLSADDKWVDDPTSSDYNRLVRGPTSARSFETLLRKDDLYDLFVVLEYNSQPIVKGKGSAIFMHLWQSPETGTAGCVALKRKDLVNLISWLDPHKNPKILIGELNSLDTTTP
jgi:L,D-peptidoglycan transpeptidase YkuD (ErfK/YbiS/YcfS/YnhG family)